MGFNPVRIISHSGMSSNPLADFERNFRQFNVTGPHVAYTCLGGFVVVVCSCYASHQPSDVKWYVSWQFGMFSLFVREKVWSHLF